MHQLTFAYIGRQRGKRSLHMCSMWSSVYRFLRIVHVILKNSKLSVREMYVNGCGFRAIERVKKVHHTTIINWVKEVGITLPDTLLF